MAETPMETETLARLYLEQGFPEKAALIYERLLAKDPGRHSAVEGLKRCQALCKTLHREVDMQSEKRLLILRGLLAQLTGQKPPEEEKSNPPQKSESMARQPWASPAATSVPVELLEAQQGAETAINSMSGGDPLQRRLEVLKDMLNRLKA